MSTQQPDQPAAAGKKIIIVGAGIAGLALALSIRKQWPDVPPLPSLTIYERESNDSMQSREGYSLSIRGDALSGWMQVLQRLDILERILPFSLSAQNSRPGSFNLLVYRLDENADFQNPPHAMDKQPFGHGSTGTGPVVFIGDANHAVSPFAGNGANMAMLDGWDLAERLAGNDSMETALEAYDGRSMPRSASAVRQSRWAIDMMHATGLKLAMYRGLLWLVGLVMRWKQG